MADIFTTEERHLIMSHIRGKETKPEVRVRRYLFSKGLRFRKNDKRYPGHPDIVLPRYHAMVFVNGCFWHGHQGCKLFRMPKSNTGFWDAKIKRNILRDEQVLDTLRSQGWHVAVVWECELSTKSKFLVRMESLEAEIRENI